MNEYIPSGIFISKNNKGQIVYQDPFTHGAYIIGKSYYGKYRIYSMRIVIAIIIAILLSSLIGVLPAVLAGLVAYVIGYILFMEKFLRTYCTFVTSFKKQEQEPFIERVDKISPTPRKFVKSVLFVVFGVLIVLNAYDMNLTGFTLYFCWAIGIGACIIAVFVFTLAIRDVIRSKQKKLS